MGAINVIPTVLIQRVLDGGVLSGVAPSGTSYSFDFDNEAGGPYTAGEALSWTGGTGYLASIVDNDPIGSMVVYLSTGVAPSDGLEITGGASAATADVDGTVTNNGVPDSGETVRRGRYRRYPGLTDGGLIDIAEAIAYSGYRIRNALVSMAGITAVDFYIVDRDGNDASAGSISLTTGDGYNEWRNGGVIIAPGCKFKAVGTGTLTAEGQIMFIIGEGWGESVFDEAPLLGKSNLPPGMVRP